MDEGSLASLVEYIHISHTQLCIKDVICEDIDTWNKGLISTIILEDAKANMTSLLLDNSSFDKIIWNASSTRKYSKKYAY